MNKKEVYVIKTCDNGEPHFDVLALQQPDDAGAAGLKVVLDKATAKGNFSFDCRSRESKLGSDETNKNKALYRLEKDEMGEHLILILCLCHELELAIHAAFEKYSNLNEDAEELLSSVYYLFKHANLKWQLFKHRAITVGQQHRWFKRPSGTQWVAHQVDALVTFFHNLYTLLQYLHNQITDPYNATICKEQQWLEGILSNCSNLVVLIFNVIKSDILRLIRPTSLVLHSVSVLLPEAITTISIYLKKTQKLCEKVESNGVDTFKDVSYFPTFATDFLPLLELDETGVTLGCSTRREPVCVGVTMSGYTLTNTNLDDAFSEVHSDIVKVLAALEEALNEHFSFLAEDHVMRAAAVILDTVSYKNREENDIKEAAITLHNHFKEPLEANDFLKQQLYEFAIIFKIFIS